MLINQVKIYLLVIVFQIALHKVPVADHLISFLGLQKYIESADAIWK